MKYLSKLTSTTCNLEGVDGILTGNQNLYGAATGETWDYYVRVTDEGGFVDSLYAAANGIGDYGNSFLTGIVYAEGGFLTGGTVKAQNVLTQGIGAKGSFGLSVDNTNVITALSSGNVGVGATAPLRKLHVAGGDGFAVNASTSQYYGVFIPALGEGANPEIQIGDWHNAGARLQWNSSTRALSIDTQYSTGAGTFNITGNDFSSTFLTVASSGNVGIGTSSPSSMLTLNGTTPYIRLERGGTPTWEIRQNYPSTEYGFQIVNVTNSNIPFFIGESSNVGIGTTSPASYYSTKLVVSVGDEDGITIAGSGDNYLMFADGTTGADRYRGFIQYSHTADYMAFATDSSERMRITSSGNVGIGTVSPVSNWLSGFDPSTGNSTFKLTSEGWIVTPYLTGLASYYPAQGARPIIWSDNNGTNIQSFDNSATDGISLKSSNGTTRLFVREDGNVGIGTTSPQTFLTLNGANVSYAGQLQVASNDYAQITFYNSAALTPGASNRKASLIYSVGGNTFEIANQITNGHLILQGSDSGGGNVGIGTNSPAQKLEVNGTVYINGDGDLLFDSSTGGTGFQMDYYAGQMYFGNQAGSSWHMVMKDNGNVGIGTTAPEEKLHVSGSTFISYSGTNANYFGQGNALGYGRIRPFNNSGFLAFDTNYTAGGGYDFAYNGSSVVRINSSGNVGIGTTSPGGKLTVVGDGTEYSNIVLRHSTNQEHLIYASTNVQYNLIGSSTPTWIWGQQSASERMRLNNTGLGIGTSSPESKLHINSSISDGIIVRTTANVEPFIALQRNTGSNGVAVLREFDGGNLYIDTGATGAAQSTKMTVTASGNVGIGTSSPGVKLHVLGASTGYLFRVQGSSTLNVYDPGGGGEIGIGAGSGQRLKLYANDALNTGITIDTGGNVGIGTTSPNAKLDVAGDIWLSQTGRLQGRAYPYDTTVGSGADASTTIVDAGSTSGYRSRIILAGGNATDPNTIKFLTTSAERMRITSAGNVGIGTASPVQKLSVFGNIYQRTGDFITWNNGDAQIGAVSGYNLAFSTYDGVSAMLERMRITSAGNVLIGTTTDAGYKLDVNGNTRLNGDTTSIGYLQTYGLFYHRDNFNVLNKAANGWLTWVTRNTSEAEATINLDYVRSINGTNGGNVGIGTTSPSEKLDVAGNIQVHGNYIKFDEGTNAESRIVSSANYLEIIGNGPSAASSARMWLGKGGSVDSGYYVNGNQLFFRGLDSSTKMYINGSSGNVGIGTSSPYHKLDVVGTIGGSYYSDSYLEFNSSGHTVLKANNDVILGYSSNLYVKQSGNVGIGTNSPGARLNIAGNLGAVIGAGNSAIKMTNTDTGNFASISAGIVGISNSGMDFSVDGARSMVISGAGNVGIGTDSPIYKLHVAGSAYVNGGTLFIDSGNFLMWGNSAQGIRGVNDTSLEFVAGSSERMRITNNGNVGIGTNSPTEKLEVQNGTAGAKIKVSNSVGGYASLECSSNATSVAQLSFTNQLSLIGGNVGIGTTSPAYKLDVAGTFQSQGNATFNGSNVYINSDNTVVGNNTTDVVGISGNTMYFPGTGNVGIGTTSPDTKLHIVNDSATTNAGVKVLTLTQSTSGTPASGLGPGITFVSERPAGNVLLERAAIYGIAGADADDDGDLAFYTRTDTGAIGVSEKVRITSDGNVGIGTTSPGTNLQVNGGSDTNIRVVSSAGGYAAIQFGDTADTVRGAISYNSGNNSISIRGYDNSDRLLINSAGNVGIGTTSPSSKLQLGEDASTLGSNVFTMYRGGSTGQYTTIENQGGTVYKSHGVGGHAFYHDPAQEAMRVAATTGNLLVGTSTDAGYRLDVQGGDARFAQNVDAASYSVAGNPGWSGTVNFPTNPPGQQNLQFANGILVNVF